MSYASIRNNARNRLNENLQFLNYISTLEPVNPRDPVPLEVNIMKGLFYVHIYSSLEKTVNELVEFTITSISAKTINQKHYFPAFHTIAAYDKLVAFKEGGYRNFFSRAYDIFDGTQQSTSVALNESVFASSLQNVWLSTIEEVSKCFGIKNLSATPRVRTTLNEIVDKRNAVAHGRENAAVIGSRFRTPVMRTKYNETSDFVYELIDLYEDYLIKKNYLIGSTKRIYP